MPDVPTGITVQRIADPTQLQQFKDMTMKYLEWLAEDLCFQSIDDELDGLPGCYAPAAGGTMLLACTATGTCIGAVALRALAGKQTEGLCDVDGIPVEQLAEMKRLFVVPEHHGAGVGAALANAVIEEAVTLGYTGMVLDTLERLTGANALYKKLGFQPCPAYNFCPLPGVLYWMKKF
jgi:putative acetyltransferase